MKLKRVPQIATETLRSSKRRYQFGDPDANDGLAMQNLAGLGVGYLPWTSSALRPADAQRIMNDILLNERQVIVEFGSGLSTLLIAALSRQFGLKLRLFAVDENAQWLDRIATQVAGANSDIEFEAIHAPLVKYEDSADLPVSRWHDRAALSQLPDSGVDLVVCDGPTAVDERVQYDRWPALPTMYSRLSQRCGVHLDDTMRAGELAIVRDWSDRFPEMAVTRHAFSTYFCRGTSYNI